MVSNGERGDHGLIVLSVDSEEEEIGDVVDNVGQAEEVDVVGWELVVVKVEVLKRRFYPCGY